MGVRLGLRVGWIVLLALLVLGALGSGALAGRNLFDDEDYTDCPSGTRLQALSNVRVMRTDEDDELKVSWDMTQPASWQLGPNVYSASITLILESDDKTITADKALGSTSHTFEDLAQSTDWKVQVAVTDRKYVISDIVEAEITSSAPAPWFDVPIWYGVPSDRSKVANWKTHMTENRVGRFYYLGFNKEFWNWYITRAGENANSYFRDDLNSKFRVGLRHNMDETAVEEVDFDHFRVRVLDSGGDDVLGFDAKTVGNGDGKYAWPTSPLYRSTVTDEQGNDIPNIAQGWRWAVGGTFPASDFASDGKYAPGKGDTIHFANHVRSSKLENGGAPAIRSLFPPAAIYGLATTNAESSILEQTKTALETVPIRDNFPGNTSRFPAQGFTPLVPRACTICRRTSSWKMTITRLRAGWKTKMMSRSVPGRA